MRAGLVIPDATPFVTRTYAPIWDVGLRPIAPLSVKMTQALRLDTRSAIEREWVDLFFNLIEPFHDPDLDLFARSDEPVEMQYLLTRK